MTLSIGHDQAAELLALLPPGHELSPALRDYARLDEESTVLHRRLAAYGGPSDPGRDALRRDVEDWCERVMQYAALAHEAVYLNCCADWGGLFDEGPLPRPT